MMATFWTWCKEKLWPALKEFGWVLLGIPLAILFLFKRDRSVVVDPLAEADARHEEYEAERERLLDEAERELQKKLREINQRYTEETAKKIIEQEQAAFERVKGDPEALTKWLKEVARRADSE